MKNIQKLRLSNDELENENRDITDKIAKIRAKIGGGLNLDGSIQASSKMKGIDELNRLKAKNEDYNFCRKKVVLLLLGLTFFLPSKTSI